MKIIRASLGDTVVYANDEENGFADVLQEEFDEYLRALKAMVEFETKVDLQYEARSV